MSVTRSLSSAVPHTTMLSVIRKYPLTSYFVLAFGLSWSGVIAAIGGGPIPGTPQDAERLFVFVYLAMLLGPSVAGITLTGVTGGRSGLRDYRSRLLRWRVPTRWYAVALLTAPLSLGATLFVLSIVSAAFTPGILIAGSGDVTGLPISAPSGMSLLLQGLAIGIGAGFFEELGWTGFAVPRLNARRGIIVAGLTIGVLWGLWHLLAIWWGSANAFGSAAVPLFLTVALLSFLPPYRVLMVWVYRHTGSLFVAILMHASLTASMLILGPNVTGHALIAYDLAFSAMLWILVTCVWGWSAGREPSAVARPVEPHAA